MSLPRQTGPVMVVGSEWEELKRLRAALRYIAEHCGDDSRPEDNPVQIARDALEAPDEQ